MISFSDLPTDLQRAAEDYYAALALVEENPTRSLLWALEATTVACRAELVAGPKPGGTPIGFIFHASAWAGAELDYFETRPAGEDAYEMRPITHPADANGLSLVSTEWAVWEQEDGRWVSDALCLGEEFQVGS